MGVVKKVIKMELKKPRSFDNCIEIARKRFQKHFYNDIR